MPPITDPTSKSDAVIYDQFHGQGGSYILDPKTGERKRVEEPTQDHPDGHCARDEKGNPIGAAAAAPQPGVAGRAAADTATERRSK